MKTAGVVVTYNRKEELVKNIRAILSQSYVVDRYYIIDNHSSDNTEQLLKEEGILDNQVIKYVYLKENIGGSGGFYTGLKMAYEDGYDFICLMDDDGRPADDKMMETLVNRAEKVYSANKLLLLNSLVCGPDDILSFGLNGGIKTKQIAAEREKNNLIVGTINPFNGTLVSKELVEKIGYPNKDFFIKGDEQDYYYRALKANAFVATVFDSNYYHPVLERKYFKILGKTKKGSTEAPWKEYYRARNFTYMFKRDGETIKYVRQNVRQILIAIKYNPKKIQTIKMISKGWKDGVSGRLGPTVKP